MNNSFLYKALSRIIDVRPEEVFSALSMFFYFFLVTSPAYIIKPVRDSLYLHWLGAERLPFAYLLTAALIGFIVTLNSRLLRSTKRNVFISLSLGFFCLCLILFWGLFKLEWKWLSIVYYFWSDIFLITSITQFWMYVNEIYNPHQARRLVGFFVSGGLLGGVVGSIITSLLSSKIGTENLLLICPVLLVLCIVIVNNVQKYIPLEKEKDEEPELKTKKEKVGYLESFNVFKGNRHLMLIAGIMAVTIIVTTLIDFQFKTVIQYSFGGNVHKMTSVLGTFFSVLLIFSYFLHILLTKRILKNFGLLLGLMIGPVFLLGGVLVVFAVPLGAMIIWALLVKGTDKSLSHSLTQSVRELLYIPVPQNIKFKAKPFIDMFVNKFAKGLGALLFLMFYTILHFSIRNISLIVSFFIVVWVILNTFVYKEYVKSVKKKLKIKWLDGDKYVRERVDVGLAGLIFDTLESKKKSSILYAMNIFDLVKKDKMTPELKTLISSKSDEIHASAMDSLFELDGEVLAPDIEDVLEDEEISTQIEEIMSLDVYKNVMSSHLEKVVEDESPATEVERMETAKILGMMESTPDTIKSLAKLLKDKSPEVIRYALESAGKHKDNELVPPIIKQLCESCNREAASNTLFAYGEDVIAILGKHLDDPEEDISVRKAIPSILARIGSQKVANLFIREIEKHNHDLENDIIEAMFRMKTDHSEILYRENIIEKVLIHIIKDCYIILREIGENLTKKGNEVQISELENKYSLGLKKIFDLLGCIYPQQDIIRAYQNISSGTKKGIDYSLELLDTLLKKDMKKYFIPLIDDTSLEDKVRKSRKILKSIGKERIS